MFDPSAILQEMRVTEKATALTSNLNQYTFKVAKTATKPQIAAAVERAFAAQSIKVVSVKVINVKPSRKRDRARRGLFSTVPGYKKALVTLRAGDKLDLLG